jgi:hypothetical protein
MPAPPPSGEVFVAEAAAESSQRVELGSGHPGEGRMHGWMPGRGGRAGGCRAGGGSPVLESQAKVLRRRSGSIEGSGRERTRKATGRVRITFGKKGSNPLHLASFWVIHTAYWALFRLG